MLRVLLDPADLVALARAFTRPPLNLDPLRALALLRDRGERSPLSSLKTWAPAASFADLLEDLASEATRLDVRDLFFELMNRSRYLEVVGQALEPGEAARVTANVSRFAEMIAEFSENEADRSLSPYLHHLALLPLSRAPQPPAPVHPPHHAPHAPTIHQAKGLE